MTDNFKPPQEELPAIADLLKIGEIDAAIVNDAAKTFKENPPDEDLKNLLESE